MSDTKTFEGWAIVELMGHAVLAGYVSQEAIAGTAMLRIDVPDVEGQPGFTKYQSGGSVYGITPTTEGNARIAAESVKARPVQLWIVPSVTPRSISLSFRNDATSYVPATDHDGDGDDHQEEDDSWETDVDRRDTDW